MSHIDLIEVTIRDLDALRLAGLECGLELVPQSTFRWYGRYMGDWPLPEGITQDMLGKCDYVLRIPGNDSAYEVGVVKVGDHYVLLWDFWQRGFGLQDRIGDKGEKLRTAYSRHATMNILKKHGVSVVHQVDKTNGGTRLYVRPTRQMLNAAHQLTTARR